MDAPESFRPGGTVPFPPSPIRRPHRGRTIGAVLAAGALLAVPAAAGADVWTIDAARSEIVAHTDKAGFLGFAGHHHVIVADRFEGTIEFDPARPDRASIELVIDAASLRVADEGKPEDVPKIQKEMETAVLEVEEFPEIVFRSSSVEVKKSDDGPHELEVRGILRLHGESRVVKLDVRIEETAGEETETGGVILTTETEIKQTSYGIDPVSVGLGAVKVKDEVKLSFRLVGG